MWGTSVLPPRPAACCCCWCCCCPPRVCGQRERCPSGTDQTRHPQQPQPAPPCSTGSCSLQDRAVRGSTGQAVSAGGGGGGGVRRRNSPAQLPISQNLRGRQRQQVDERYAQTPPDAPSPDSSARRRTHFWNCPRTARLPRITSILKSQSPAGRQAVRGSAGQ